MTAITTSNGAYHADAKGNGSTGSLPVVRLWGNKGNRVGVLLPPNQTAKSAKGRSASGFSLRKTVASSMRARL